MSARADWEERARLCGRCGGENQAEGTLLDDLKETFVNLRRYRMKLNPEKCTFGVPAGQLLGYIVSQRGIKTNPSKIRAIEALEPPT
jgi:hypothetical protein